jgi:hypothetical protein
MTITSLWSVLDEQSRRTNTTRFPRFLARGRYTSPNQAAPRCNIDVMTAGVGHTDLKIRRGDITAPRCNLGRVYGWFLRSAGS